MFPREYVHEPKGESSITFSNLGNFCFFFLSLQLLTL